MKYGEEMSTAATMQTVVAAIDKGLMS